MTDECPAKENRYRRSSGAKEFTKLSTQSKSVFRKGGLDLRHLRGVRFAQSYPRLLLTWDEISGIEKWLVLGVCGLWSAAEPSKNRKMRARSNSVSLFEDDDLGRGEELPIFTLPKLTNKKQNKQQTPRQLFDTSTRLLCTHLVTTFVFSSTVTFAASIYFCLHAASQPITV